MKGGRVNQISYHLLTTKHRLAPGSYRVRIFGQMHPASFKEFFLTVHEGDRTELPVRVTGNIMPSREDSDDEIWAKMMAPSVVVDIADTAHQKVFATPDSSGRILGNLHGQSQALSVMEIQENWARIQAWNHENGGFMEGWVPLKKLKVPVHELAMMMSIALRFIPTLIEETDKIMSAQKARGADFDTGNLMQKARAMIPLLVPLFISSFRRADELATAMECRCYHGGEGRTKLHQLRYRWIDTVALGFCVILFTGVIVAARGFGL